MDDKDKEILSLKQEIINLSLKNYNQNQELEAAEAALDGALSLLEDARRQHEMDLELMMEDIYTIGHLEEWENRHARESAQLRRVLAEIVYYGRKPTEDESVMMFKHATQILTSTTSGEALENELREAHDVIRVYVHDALLLLKRVQQPSDTWASSNEEWLLYVNDVARKILTRAMESYEKNTKNKYKGE